MASDIFHRARIGGVDLVAGIDTDGPYIARHDHLEGVSLGICQLRKFEPHFGVGHAFGWYVVKYHDESRIDLSGFTDEQALEVAREFGIVIYDSNGSVAVRPCAFYYGRAWEGFKAWTKAHPRLAKRYAKEEQPYLWNCYDRAMGLMPILECHPDLFAHYRPWWISPPANRPPQSAG